MYLRWVPTKASKPTTVGLSPIWTSASETYISTRNRCLYLPLRLIPVVRVPRGPESPRWFSAVQVASEYSGGQPTEVPLVSCTFGVAEGLEKHSPAIARETVRFGTRMSSYTVRPETQGHTRGILLWRFEWQKED